LCFGSSYLSKWQSAAIFVLTLIVWCAMSSAGAPLLASELDSQWSTLTDAGLSAYRRNDLVNAEKLLSKALLKSHEFPASDPRRLKSMNTLAAVFVAQKRYTESIAVFESVVKLSERNMVSNPVAKDSANAQSIIALEQLVKLYRSLGKTGLAQTTQAKLNNLSKRVPVAKREFP
jgi:tetratricopeptide (TPR) repeat protein